MIYPTANKTMSATVNHTKPSPEIHAFIYLKATNSSSGLHNQDDFMTIINPAEIQASAWKQLSYFRVYVGDDGYPQNARHPILNNKRQQIPVTVRLAARDAAGNFVKIPQSDLDSIRLIDYTSSVLIDHGTNFSGQWTTSYLNQGYEWDREFMGSIRSLRLEQPELFEEVENRADIPESYEVNSSPHTEDHPNALVLTDACADGYQCIRFYLSTGASLPRRLAARILNSDGTTFRTNYKEISDDIGEGDGLGKFNSSFEVDPFAFPNLPNENYGDRKTDGSGHLKPTLASTFRFDSQNYHAYEQHLNIRMPGGRKIPINSVVHPANMHPVYGAESIWAYGGKGQSRITHTYMVYPGERHTRQGPSPKYFSRNNYFYGIFGLLGFAFEYKDPHVVYPRAGEVVIGHFCSSANYYFYDQPNANPGSQVPFKLATLFSVIDIYGTQHNFRLSLSEDYGSLLLSKT